MAGVAGWALTTAQSWAKPDTVRTDRHTHKDTHTLPWSPGWGRHWAAQATMTTPSHSPHMPLPTFLLAPSMAPSLSSSTRLTRLNLFKNGWRGGGGHLSFLFILNQIPGHQQHLQPHGRGGVAGGGGDEDASLIPACPRTWRSSLRTAEIKALSAPGRVWGGRLPGGLEWLSCQWRETLEFSTLKSRAEVGAE